ncbi:hypothetical protein [Peterkaempfera griseoplana]|uniref:hypothetical protein n=1 Tax=Peterkaempfera griseoplana TaxID=66896 RepID=UPI0012FEA5F9|nr:hypothetical protein [Peterkaempfera griseoplana]
MGSGDEQRMCGAFVGWLRTHGWKILEESCTKDCVDIEAWHADGARLLVEVQGDTTDPGPDLDTAYGRLLRRMDGVPSSRYAVVVPEDALDAALRVLPQVREALALDVYAVGPGGEVYRADR